MRGTPPVQLAFLLLGFFLLAVPLVQLTHGRTEPVAAARPVATGEGRQVFIRARYAHQPVKLLVKHGADDLLPQPDLAVSPVEGRAKIEIPQAGLELSVQAEWPAGTPDTALTIEVDPDALESRSQTLWSQDGRIEDTMFFSWK